MGSAVEYPKRASDSSGDVKIKCGRREQTVAPGPTFVFDFDDYEEPSEMRGCSPPRESFGEWPRDERTRTDGDEDVPSDDERYNLNNYKVLEIEPPEVENNKDLVVPPTEYRWPWSDDEYPPDRPVVAAPWVPWFHEVHRPDLAYADLPWVREKSVPLVKVSAEEDARRLELIQTAEIEEISRLCGAMEDYDASDHGTDISYSDDYEIDVSSDISSNEEDPLVVLHIPIEPDDPRLRGGFFYATVDIIRGGEGLEEALDLYDDTTHSAYGRRQSQVHILDAEPMESQISIMKFVVLRILLMRLLAKPRVLCCSLTESVCV